MNFLEDYRRTLIGLLKNMGYAPEEGLDVLPLAIQYFNAKRRRISAQPRKVAYSQEFYCPTQFKNHLNDLLKKIEQGEDVNPYLSKGIEKIDGNDALLNDWGIFHFHLGSMVPGSKHSTRTQELLFAVVREKDFYCIQIGKHGDWAKEVLLEIVSKNWPSLLAIWKVPDGFSLEPNVTETDRLKLRKHGINTFSQLSNGEIYAPLGGGYASDGTSVEVVRKVHRIIKNIRDFQKNVEKDTQLKSAISDQKGYTGDLDLHIGVLECDPEKFFLIELNSKCSYPIENSNLWIA